jgi:hypothetical protein
MGRNIVDKVQKRQLNWSGHANRMDVTRWSRKVLKWVPQEKRERGRPKRAWRDDMKEAMETRNLDKEDCYRREEWRLGSEKRRQL